MSEIIYSTNFAAEAADFILRKAGQALSARGSFRLSLSGGNTPKAVYQELRQRGVDASRWVITFGDERCVPPTDAQSNFRMASEAWLVSSDATVLRLKGEINPVEAALEYERELSAISPEEVFRHDLVLLGLGDDGHTASLFPETEALAETERLVMANFVPKLDVWRLTFTFPFLNASRDILFLVNDPAKDALVSEIRAGETTHPAGRIRPWAGGLTWLVGHG